MSVGIGGYRGLVTRVRYSPSQVASNLPLVWNLPRWPREGQTAAVVRCKRGAGKCAHTCQTDEFKEGCLVDGEFKRCEHEHSGHDGCGKCVCIDPAKIITTEPRESDNLAMAIDLRIAWIYSELPQRVREALMLRHAKGMTVEEIAKEQGCVPSTAHLRLSLGHSVIADYLNGVR